MGEFDVFDAPAAPAKGGGEFAEFDDPGKPKPAPGEKRPFLEEAGARFKGAVSPLIDLFSNATLPTSFADAAARLKQNGPALLQGQIDAAKNLRDTVLDANAAGNRALLHPVETFGGGGATPAINETLRGAYSNLPLVNLINERAFGVPEVSPEDAARAPGFRPLGSLAGAVATGKLATAAGERVGAALERAGSAAAERGVERTVEKLAEGAGKRNRIKIEESQPVEDLARERPEIAKAAGDDAKLAKRVEAVHREASEKLGKIYSEAGAQDKGVASAVEAIDNMDRKIAELRASPEASVRRSAEALQKVRDEFDQNFGAGGNFEVKQLRAAQSDYQKQGYAKAIPGMHGYEEASASIEAAREASKAVGEAVVQNVTGMSWQKAKAAAARDPNSLAGRLFKANDQVAAANRIEAGIADRAAKPKAGPGLASKLMHFGKHVRHSPFGAVAGPALEAASEVPALVDRALARPGVARLPREGAPLAVAANASGAFSPDQALRDLLARAGQGDELAAARLAALARAPIVAARIDALRRQAGGM